MKERPILFSGAMVRAILADQKTQTRRVMKTQPIVVRRWANADTDGVRWTWPNGDEATYADRSDVLASYLERDFWPHCPYGKPGDRLWVRETWYCDHCFERDYEKTRTTTFVGRTLTDAECEAEWRGTDRTGSLLYYRADGEAHQQFEQLEHDSGRIWKPSIHMPRWASRLTLEVTEVRVQRLQEISEEDAREEGVEAAPFCKAGRPNGMEHVEAFEDLWTAINGERPGCAWNSNPWVWCVSFRRVE